MAVGSSHGPAGRSVALAELWDGSAWKTLPTPNPSDGRGSVLTAVSCTGPAACVATGSYDNSTGNQHVPLAEAWNGTAWTVQPAPNPPHAQVSGFSGVSCTGGGACTAVGNAGPLVGLFGVDVPLAEQRPA